jgi:hypothetical protein
VQADSVQDLVSALSFSLLLALAAGRLLLSRRRLLSEVERLTFAPVVASVLLAVFFTLLRMRIPLDGLTILLAAISATSLTQRQEQRSSARCQVTRR